MGGVNGDHLHLVVDNANSIGFDRHNLEVLPYTNPEHTVVNKLVFVDRSIPNQMLLFLVVVTNQSRVNVSLLFKNERVYLEAEYKTPVSTFESAIVENTSGQQHSFKLLQVDNVCSLSAVISTSREKGKNSSIQAEYFSPRIVIVALAVFVFIWKEDLW